MLRLAADENFDQRILNGLRRRLPDLDVVRVLDVGLGSASDPGILEWAAQENRILLAHDVATVTRFAYERAAAGEPMPGVFEVPQRLHIGRAIEDLLLLATASEAGEWDGQVRYLPL